MKITWQELTTRARARGINGELLPLVNPQDFAWV
jgi:hypothetical protein